MPIIRWNDSFSVNVAEIDAQHQRLLEFLNELYDAMLKKKGKEALVNILVDLTDYALVHFRTEEKYFAKFQYPDAESHIKEHGEFKKKVMDFKRRFDSNEIGVAIDVMDFLVSWLKSHIQQVDKKYAAFFNAQGLK